MRATGINHVSISAPDLEASVHFYTEVFGMERVPAPRFPNLRVAWLQLGHQQLHLFQRDGAPEAPEFHHLGIDVDDFEAVYVKLRELALHDQVTFVSGVVVLPGGEAQMYFRDPAGNLVEIDWPDASTLDRSVVSDIMVLSEIEPQSEENRAAHLYPEALRLSGEA